jgi:hypothetical protein
MKKMTRKEYMENSSENFSEYYAQFITSETTAFINSSIGIEKLKTSKCKHLNDLYSHSNGGAGSWIWDLTPFNKELAREMGENFSPSTHTCIGKECARQLLEEEGATL